jgi:hypothetical protein
MPPVPLLVGSTPRGEPLLQTKPAEPLAGLRKPTTKSVEVPHKKPPAKKAAAAKNAPEPRRRRTS